MYEGTIPLTALNVPAVGFEALLVKVLAAGTEQNTSFVPALKSTMPPLALEDMTKSLESVVPLDVYVPTPVSHSEAVLLAIV